MCLWRPLRPVRRRLSRTGASPGQHRGFWRHLSPEVTCGPLRRAGPSTPRRSSTPAMRLARGWPQSLPRHSSQRWASTPLNGDTPETLLNKNEAPTAAHAHLQVASLVTCGPELSGGHPNTSNFQRLPGKLVGPPVSECSTLNLVPMPSAAGIARSNPARRVESAIAVCASCNQRSMESDSLARLRRIRHQRSRP